MAREGFTVSAAATLQEARANMAERRPDVVQLMQQKGVGPVTALAFVLTIGPVERFRNSRAWGR